MQGTAFGGLSLTQFVSSILGMATGAAVFRSRGLVHPVFFGRRPSSRPNDARRAGAGRGGGQMAGTRRAAKRVCPPRSDPQLELTLLAERPGRKGGTPGGLGGGRGENRAGRRTARGRTGRDSKPRTFEGPTCENKKSKAAPAKQRFAGKGFAFLFERRDERTADLITEKPLTNLCNLWKYEHLFRLNRNSPILSCGEVPLVKMTLPCFPLCCRDGI